MRFPAPTLMLLAVVLAIFCSCQKYDEGPSFSLRTKTFRATNNWRIDKATQNGIDATNETRIGVNLKSDGTVIFKDTTATAGGDVVDIQNGVWEFDNNGENLLLVFTKPGGGVNSAKVWYILRLTTTELWVTEMDDNDNLYRYEFIPR